MNAHPFERKLTETKLDIYCKWNDEV